MSFLVQFDENRVRMSAAGFFKVGKHLIPSVSIAFYYCASPQQVFLIVVYFL